MKLLKTLMTALVTTGVSLSACASSTGNQSENKLENNNDMKAVVVYFSYSGNTEKAAKELAKTIDAPVYRIEPVQPYSVEDVDWKNEQSRCTQEYHDQTLRPAIKPLDIAWANVDTVFIGFPIWWYQEPAVIRSFLDDYKTQLQGKVLYPFCTAHSSPMSVADESLAKGFPDFKWKTGLRFMRDTDKQQIENWINQ